MLFASCLRGGSVTSSEREIFLQAEEGRAENTKLGLFSSGPAPACARLRMELGGAGSPGRLSPSSPSSSPIRLHTKGALSRQVSVHLLQVETNGLPPRCQLPSFCCCRCCVLSRGASHTLVHATPPFPKAPGDPGVDSGPLYPRRPALESCHGHRPCWDPASPLRALLPCQGHISPPFGEDV